MGLAPYGIPKYKEIILNQIMDLKEDGSFRLRMEYFNYATGLTMTNDKFSKLFGRDPRKSNEEIEKFHANVASSIQFAIEEVILKFASYCRKKFH